MLRAGLTLRCRRVRAEGATCEGCPMRLHESFQALGERRTRIIVHHSWQQAFVQRIIILRMVSRKRINLEKVQASLDVICPKCGKVITPAEMQRIDFERMKCPACGERFARCRTAITAAAELTVLYNGAMIRASRWIEDQILPLFAQIPRARLARPPLQPHYQSHAYWAITALGLLIWRN